jgi:hypothetical protein
MTHKIWIQKWFCWKILGSDSDAVEDSSFVICDTQLIGT